MRVREVHHLRLATTRECVGEEPLADLFPRPVRDGDAHAVDLRGERRRRGLQTEDRLARRKRDDGALARLIEVAVIGDELQFRL